MKIPYTMRFSGRYGGHSKKWSGPGVVWIIVRGPEIIDVFDYEANDYIAAKDKYGQVKTFYSVAAARKWANKHPERLP